MWNLIKKKVKSKEVVSYKARTVYPLRGLQIHKI